jgi:hypothetical protein
LRHYYAAKVRGRPKFGNTEGCPVDILRQRAAGQDDMYAGTYSEALCYLEDPDIVRAAGELKIRRYKNRTTPAVGRGAKIKPADISRFQLRVIGRTSLRVGVGGSRGADSGG